MGNSLPGHSLGGGTATLYNSQSVQMEPSTSLMVSYCVVISYTGSKCCIATGAYRHHPSGPEGHQGEDRSAAEGIPGAAEHQDVPGDRDHHLQVRRTRVQLIEW